jgi:hypothetical protein
VFGSDGSKFRLPVVPHRVGSLFLPDDGNIFSFINLMTLIKAG